MKQHGTHLLEMMLNEKADYKNMCRVRLQASEKYMLGKKTLKKFM